MEALGPVSPSLKRLWRRMVEASVRRRSDDAPCKGMTSHQSFDAAPNGCELAAQQQFRANRRAPRCREPPDGRRSCRELRVVDVTRGRAARATREAPSRWGGDEPAAKPLTQRLSTGYPLSSAGYGSESRVPALQMQTEPTTTNPASGEANPRRSSVSQGCPGLVIATGGSAEAGTAAAAGAENRVGLSFGRDHPRR
jgi:hypothetical protein